MNYFICFPISAQLARRHCQARPACAPQAGPAQAQPTPPSNKNHHLKQYSQYPAFLPYIDTPPLPLYDARLDAMPSPAILHNLLVTRAPGHTPI